MEFNVNTPLLFIVVGIIVALVLGQSVFFLLKAFTLFSIVSSPIFWFNVKYAKLTNFYFTGLIVKLKFIFFSQTRYFSASCGPQELEPIPETL